MKTSSGSQRHTHNRRKTSKEGRSCSTVLLIFWTLVLSWLIFIFYFWKSGRLHSTKIPSLKFVDGILNDAEISIRRNLAPPVLTVSVTEKSDIHVVFSTDCSPYQDWQTLVVFHSAMVVGQKGPVTRIASGCDDEKKLVLTALYKKLHPNYHVHYTPDFKKDEKSQRSYDFYNKPWGVKHWLDFAVPKIPDDIAIAVIDPDMIFVRPLVTKIRGQDNNLHDRKIKESDLMEKISLGHPVAQMYGLGAPWTNDTHLKFNRMRICGPGSPCLEPSMRFGEAHYSVGPPYIVIKQDMVRLTETWTKLVPRVYEGYPYLLAEMYAYSMAAAHENLPHLQLENYMVSNTGAGGEGWPLIDKLDDVCIPPVDGIYYPGVPLPNLIHFCQNFRVGDIGFAKRQVPRDIFSCDQPMLVEPPIDLSRVSHRIKNGEKEGLNKKQVKRNAFQICVIHRSINAALTDYKKRMCDGSSSTNYEKTLIVLPHG